MVTITGVRRAESSKRSLRNSVEISGHKFSGTIDEFNMAFHANDEGLQHQCIKGKDKIIINPIIDWTDADVWSFIRDYLKIDFCKLYNKGYHRLGCILCPMASLAEKNKMLIDYPNVKNGYLKLIQDIKEARKETFGIWAENPEIILDWWIKKKPIKQYLEDLKKQLRLNL